MGQKADRVGAQTSRSTCTVRRRARDDSGSALIETAVTLSVALILLVGTIEVGSMMRTYSSTSSSVRSAARVASVAGSDPMADRRILARIYQEAGGVRPMRIRKVVIWHAQGPGEAVPPACDLPAGEQPSTISIGVSDGGVDALGACNVYLNPDLPGGAFAMATGEAASPPSYYFACQGPLDPDAANKVDCRWPGKNRRALTSPRSSIGPGISPDFIGVHVQVDHRFAGALVLDALTIRETAISLLEPQGYTVL